MSSFSDAPASLLSDSHAWQPLSPPLEIALGVPTTAQCGWRLVVLQLSELLQPENGVHQIGVRLVLAGDSVQPIAVGFVGEVRWGPQVLLARTLCVCGVQHMPSNCNMQRAAYDVRLATRRTRRARCCCSAVVRHAHRPPMRPDCTRDVAR